MTNPTSNEEFPDPVTRKSVIGKVLDSRPDAWKVLNDEFKLPCWDCAVAETETIEEGARYYGHDADAIVKKLNACKLVLPEPESKEEATEQPPAK